MAVCNSCWVDVAHVMGNYRRAARPPGILPDDVSDTGAHQRQSNSDTPHYALTNCPQRIALQETIFIKLPFYGSFSAIARSSSSNVSTIKFDQRNYSVVRETVMG